MAGTAAFDVLEVLGRLLKDRDPRNPQDTFQKIVDATTKLTGAERAVLVSATGEVLVRTPDATHDPVVAREAIDTKTLVAHGPVAACALELHGTVAAAIAIGTAFDATFTPKDLERLEKVAEFAAPLLEALVGQKQAEDARRRAEKVHRVTVKKLENARDTARLGPLGRLVGRAPVWVDEVLTKVKKLVDANTLTLIRGETGTGKDVIAEVLHDASPRAEKPFLVVNMAELTDTLLESELFGHTKGAFTGATQDRKGIFEAANGGTVFLDEIGELKLASQAKLLRVLQNRQVRPLGATKPVKIDVRVVAATNRDLEAMVAEGTFREDLYERLNVSTIHVPPLRARLSDVKELAEHLLRRIARESKTAPRTLGPEALEVLEGHSWPRNVRQLENVLRDAVVEQHEPIRAEDLSIVKENPEAQHRRAVLAALAETSWNITAVATRFGVCRMTMYRRLKRWGIPLPSQEGASQAG